MEAMHIACGLISAASGAIVAAAYAGYTFKQRMRYACRTPWLWLLIGTNAAMAIAASALVTPSIIAKVGQSPTAPYTAAALSGSLFLVSSMVGIRKPPFGGDRKFLDLVSFVLAPVEDAITSRTHEAILELARKIGREGVTAPTLAQVIEDLAESRIRDSEARQQYGVKVDECRENLETLVDLALELWSERCITAELVPRCVQCQHVSAAQTRDAAGLP
jgi:hypothetical protein